MARRKQKSECARYVTLKGGTIVSIAAMQLLLHLEAKRIAVWIDAEDLLWIGAGHTPSEFELCRVHADELRALLRYTPTDSQTVSCGISKSAWARHHTDGTEEER